MMNNQGTTRILTNLCLLLIIGLVSLATFGTRLLSDAQGPALKGRMGAAGVGLQIAVEADTDVGAYMDTLEALSARGTFFFCDQCAADDEAISQVKQRGHGVGRYACAAHDGEEAGMYIGGGYSVPVMSYEDGDALLSVCPSINLAKLKKLDNWLTVLGDRLRGGMFLYVAADNDQAEFKKIVQIVLDKGYTILKVDEML
jgi:hypothetical protein